MSEGTALKPSGTPPVAAFAETRRTWTETTAEIPTRLGLILLKATTTPSGIDTRYEIMIRIGSSRAEPEDLGFATTTIGPLHLESVDTLAREELKKLGFKDGDKFAVIGSFYPFNYLERFLPLRGSMRGVGIATMIEEHIEKDLAATGAVGIALSAENAEAARFWEKRGFKPHPSLTFPHPPSHGVVFIKDLRQQGTPKT